jgi:hypothetical protein
MRQTMKLPCCHYWAPRLKRLHTLGS